jgi:NAD(P)-dependent dehydrogenase (short-subunit alcohol dehydrogenase family)
MKLLIITGGSKGLGYALYKQFKAKEYKIIEFSRSAPHEFSIKTDLANPEKSRLSVVNAIAPIDIDALDELIVINNAGMLSPIGPAAKKSPDELVANLNTNFVSAIVVMSEIVAKFQSARCRKVIANITSGAAQRARFGWSLYCATKAGMENFIRSLAMEQEKEEFPFIPINIDPGIIDTGMQEQIRATPKADFAEVDRFIQRKNEGLLVPPDKVAAAITQIIELPSLTFGERYETANYMS